MNKVFLSVGLCAVLALTGCYDKPPVPQVVGHDASGNAIVQNIADDSLSAGETALAAGAGAVVGSVVGNMISQPRQSPQYSGGGYVPRSTTIIQKKVVIINKAPTQRQQITRSRDWFGKSSARSFRRR